MLGTQMMLYMQGPKCSKEFKTLAELLGCSHSLRGCCLLGPPTPVCGGMRAGHLKSFEKIPGPGGLPFVGNLLSFASFRPKAHLVWADWANRFGGIYR